MKRVGLWEKGKLKKYEVEDYVFEVVKRCSVRLGTELIKLFGKEVK